jgi:hypothetical protein
MSTATVKTMAADAAETGMHAARRAITRRCRDVENLRDSAAYRVRRAPLLAVSGAFAGGIIVALGLNRFARGRRMRGEFGEW